MKRWWEAAAVEMVGLGMAIGVVFGVGIGSNGEEALKRANASLREENDALHRFIGLVVDDMERSVERAAVLLDSSGQLVTAMHEQAKREPVPIIWTRPRGNYVERVEPRVETLQRACVGDECYAWVDGEWKKIEVEP